MKDYVAMVWVAIFVTCLCIMNRKKGSKVHDQRNILVTDGSTKRDVLLKGGSPVLDNILNIAHLASYLRSKLGMKEMKVPLTSMPSSCKKYLKRLSRMNY